MVRKVIFSYLVSTAALLAAVLIRWLLDPWLGEHLPFPTLYAAVALAVWVGGYRPAAAIAVVGYLACSWLFQSPRESLALEHARDFIGLGLYLAACAIIIGLGHAARSARRVSERRAEQLEYEATLRTEIEETAREKVLGVNRQLRERVEELQTLMDIFPGGILTADPECQRITGNRAFYQMLGLPLGANVLTDMPAGTRIYRDDRELAADEYPMQAAGRTGRVVLDFDHDVVFPDRRTVTLLANTAPLLDGDGKVRGVLGAYTDITERKRAEEALRESEANFRAMFSVSSVGMAQADSTTGRFLRVNAALCCITGFTEAELLDRSVYDITHPDDHTRSREEMRRVNSGEIDTYRLDKRYLRKDGREVWVHVTVNVIRDKQGRAWRNAAVIQDITERKQAEEALKEADRRKDMFLATLAHELRNPLAPIRNAVQIMKVKQLPEREFTASRDIVERQVALMARLLDDLLDVSRITRNRLELRRRRVSLVSVLESAVETSWPLIEAAGHEFKLELPEETFHLDADPVRLAQVFANLLNNAAKYTPNGGRIRIKAERRGPALAVSVEDDGMGISPVMLPRLFDMFSQAPPALVHSQGGLGIGLSLVKGLVEMHGGRVEARSDGPGRGSTFTVYLPIDDGSAVQSEESEQASGLERRILVVDDSRDTANSMSTLLRLMGHTVHTAYDGEEAVLAAERYRPDVVVLDIGMPRLNGYDACRQIRAKTWGKGMFIVAVTGWGQETDRQQSQAAGFDSHVVKPVQQSELARVLNARLRPFFTDGAIALREGGAARG